MEKENLREKCRIKSIQLIEECANMNKLIDGAKRTTDIHYWSEEEKEYFGIKDEYEKGIKAKERKHRHSVNYWMKYYMEEECLQSVWYAMKDYGFSFDFKVKMTPGYIKVLAWKI